jgi:hypothetical protein
VPKGKTKEDRGEEACLLDDARWSNEPRRGGKKQHTHHHEASHRRRCHNFKECDVTNLYVWVAVVVLTVVPHTRLGNGDEQD